MAKKQQTYTSDSWGTPEHDAWEAAQGPRKVLHPVGCKCSQCQRLIKWAKGYQSYIAKVDR